MIVRHTPVLDQIRQSALVLGENARDYDGVLEMARGRDFVLLGEATHGTHEFYAMRAAITRRLIEEAGFDAVTVEADWPDAYRLNRFVRGTGDDDAEAAFGDFQRFPSWMWRNDVVKEFIHWLREFNMHRPEASGVGFYGMDLYSMYRSADAVIHYLQGVDPEQANAARRVYIALDHVRDPQDYGYAAASGLRPPCRDAAAGLLAELLRRSPEYLASDGIAARDAQFHAERNASVVLNAEQYYRGMFSGRSNTWNLRDAHMVNTLAALQRYLKSQGRRGRIVVWAHNSHLGDARATQMGERGEWNVGQLLREAFGTERTLLIGFTTFTGYVTAARDWDSDAERRWVRPAHRDSYEHLFYTTRLDRFFLPMREECAKALNLQLLERAIGVVYRPQSELASHYFSAALSRQFDAVFHLDETSALQPFDVSEHWTQHETPETYPTGL
jgi:erythromycin esterase-like protein